MKLSVAQVSGKINHAKCAVKFRIEVFKCLKTFVNTPNVYVQDRETVFTKTFKTFTNFVWIEIFCVKRRNIKEKKNFSQKFRQIHRKTLAPESLS